MSNVSKIGDAYAAKSMGLPPNTEFQDGGQLPKPITEVMNRAWKSAIRFRERICTAVEHPSRSTSDAMVKALGKFMSATDPQGQPHIEGDLLGIPFDRIIVAFLESEFADVRAQWLPIFETLEEGGDLALASDYLVQMWPFVDSEATKRRARHPAL